MITKCFVLAPSGVSSSCSQSTFCSSSCTLTQWCLQGAAILTFFFLRFTGCVFRLEEKAQDEEEEQSEEGDYTPTSALVSSNAESQPAVDASGSYSLLPQPQSCQQGNGNSSTDSLISHLPTRNSHQMHQSMIIVVIGSASDLSVCLAELEACLLNREEMDAYTKRVAAAPPSS